MNGDRIAQVRDTVKQYLERLEVRWGEAGGALIAASPDGEAAAIAVVEGPDAVGSGTVLVRAFTVLVAEVDADQPAPWADLVGLNADVPVVKFSYSREGAQICAEAHLIDPGMTLDALRAVLTLLWQVESRLGPRLAPDFHGRTASLLRGE